MKKPAVSNHLIARAVLGLAAVGTALLLPYFASAQNPPQTAAQQPAPVPIGTLSLQNASLVEVVDQLAQRLALNLIPDARMKGAVSINTYGDTSKMDARNLLDMILRINGFGMVQEGAIHRIVPMADVARHAIRTEINAKDIPEDDQLLMNMIFLKYMSVSELTDILKNFTGENAVLYPYTPANLLIVLDSRRGMRRTMDMIGLFDSDAFAGERVRQYELQNVRPSDLQKELEAVLKAIALDPKTPSVRFLPVDRISTLIAIAQNPGIFDTLDSWVKKLDIPVTVTTGSSDTYVYRVRYGRSDCLAQALNMLYLPLQYGGGFGSQFGGGFGGGGFGQANPYGGSGNFGAFGGGGGFGGGGFGGGGGNGGYGSTNAFSNGFGGTGGCSAGGMGANGNGNNNGGGFGGGGFGGGGFGGGGFGYPAFGGYAAQAPQVPLTGVSQNPQAQQAAQASGPPKPDPPRIVPNPLDNSLLIQADQAQYQGILKLLKELDIPPRQILLEAKIYQVDMSGAFASGVTAYFQQRTGSERRPIASLTGAITQFSAGALVTQSRELLAFLKLEENATRAHVISEPSLIATDSIPAAINVGTQVPVLTNQSASPLQVGGTNTINQQISGRNTGVTLNVNVRVNPSGIVTLIVNQEISKPAAGGGTLTPSFSQQVVQTQLTVQDGDTVAIGGIIAENGSETSSGIPLLHRIPILGAAFGTREYTHARSEFIIFMTPHVIYDSNDLLEASDELIGRVKKLRKYMKPL